MSDRQWLREYELVIGKGGGEGIKTSALRMTFEVKKTDTETPNSAVIKVWNLSENSLQRAQKEFDRVILQAGYTGNMGLIYSGNIIGTRVLRENGVNTILELTCGDGDEAYLCTVINKTLAAGAKPGDVLEEAQKGFGEFGVTKGDAPVFEGQPLPRGKVMFGAARKYMRDTCRTNDCSWSIQDGTLSICPREKYLPGEAVVLTAKTGLIGQPQQTNEGVKVKCLLNHGLRVNGRIKIDNASVLMAQVSADGKSEKKLAKLGTDGFYRILQINYSGDTHAQNWYCDMVCVAIDASGAKTIDKRGVSGT